MSADSWRDCPRCIDVAKRDLAEAEAAVAAMYGTVPITEFDAARAATPTLNDLTKAQPTFREDYEFYNAATGTLEWNYSGICTSCGLSVKVNGSQAFYRRDTPETPGGPL